MNTLFEIQFGAFGLELFAYPSNENPHDIKVSSLTATIIISGKMGSHSDDMISNVKNDLVNAAITEIQSQIKNLKGTKKALEKLQNQL